MQFARMALFSSDYKGSGKGSYTKTYNNYQGGGSGGYQKKGGYSDQGFGFGQSKDAYGGPSGSDRLMYNNKRIYLRGYNITKDKVMLAIQPKPAQFNETANSFQVSKNGYIQVDFTPFEEGTNNILPTSKRTFILLMKSVGDILDLDTRLAYDATTDEEGTYIQYHNKETEPIKVLRMNKLPD